ncbi:MAG: MATE family efflux transporter [Clostridiales bacterium]|nr:MATE family efflux transporter [Clostridiales bacterium]
MSKNKFEIDMLNGSIMPKLISFALPLMLSSILQLLFNTVDVITVGNFTGEEALAAVGSTTALINMLINLFTGISIGSNVLAARYFATKMDKEMSETVHTSVAFAIISGILMSIIGIVLARPLLLLMDTPDNVISQSVLYMRIYFIGMPFFMLYTYCAAILRAIGDTKRPLIFLFISGLLNTGLNLLLVIGFDMGVAGVAIATVASQLLSCILVVICLVKTEAVYKLDLKKLKINGHHLLTMFKVGIPAGVQGTVINFSNVLLQSSVNDFGSNAMAGYTSANNVLGYLFVSINSISQACMSFTSQNYSVRKFKRMKRVLKDCVILDIIVAGVLGGLAFLFGSQILRIFTNKQEVIKYGLEILTITSVTYVICGFMDLIPGALRGMGYSSIPMIFSIIGTVGTRIVWIYGLFPHNRTLKFLFVSYPASWILTVMMQLTYYIIALRITKRKYGNGVV